MYKTISLKLLSPTVSKRKILNEAIERYSEGFEITLRNIKHKINEMYYNNEKFNRTKFLKMLENSDFSGTEKLGIEPFKDAMKLDLARVISVYFSRRESVRNNAYPVTRTYEDDLLRVMGESSPERKEFDRIFGKFGAERPLFFCRYDEKRDYSIICDEERFFVKLYLFNRKNAVNSKRFVIFPIIVPENYRKYFTEEFYPEKFKSAELIKKGKNFYINIRIWIETEKTNEFSNYLGVIRGAEDEILYNLTDRSGRNILAGEISFEGEKGMNRIHLLANEVVKIAKENRSKLIIQNISDGKNTLATIGKKPKLTDAEYSKFVFCVNYKAELNGLADTVMLNSKRFFNLCPECNAVGRANKNNGEFSCSSCGYHSSVEATTAANTAKSLAKFKHDKVEVNVRRVETMFYFEISELGYVYQCEADEKAFDKFRDDLYHYLMKNIKNFDDNQKAIAYKISDGGEDILKFNIS